MTTPEILKAAKAVGVTSKMIRNAYSHGQCCVALDLTLDATSAERETLEKEAHTAGIEQVFALFDGYKVAGDWNEVSLDQLISDIGA